MAKIYFFGLGEHATYEELSAIELLKGAGNDIEVILSPSQNGPSVYTARLILSAFGVDVKEYSPGDFEKIDLIVSFGRPEIFEVIRGHSDKPRKVVYALTQREPKPAELKANKEGMIDEVFVGSQSLATDIVKSFVKKSNRGVEFRNGYRPFCNPNSDYFKLRYEKQRPLDCFETMRNTPDSPEYAFPAHWLMAAQISVPSTKSKHFTALNWGRKLTKVAGNPIDSGDIWNRFLEATLEPPTASWETEKETYYKASALLHFYPEEELFSYAAAKAMLSGTVVVSGPAPAFLELIKHGETGFFAKTQDEAAYFTSRLAWEPFLRMKMATEARAWFVNEGPGNADKCLPWWKGLIYG